MAEPFFGYPPSWRTETEYYERHATRVFSRYPFFHYGMIGDTPEAFLQHITGKLSLQSDSRLLDLGCGSGYLAGKVSTICHATGISTSRKCIDGCRARYPSAYFEVADMESYVSPDTTHVTALESLGYADAATTMRRIAGNLVPGGIFYLKELCRHDAEDDEQLANRLYWENFWKYRALPVGDLIRHANDAGLELIEFHDLRGRVNSATYVSSLKLNESEYRNPFPGRGDPAIPVEIIFRLPA
jgi:cyclopropane fatty-acyl-phospholipid synthase-like methyltransferase